MNKVFIGPKLRQLRKHHKHTQAELGKLIGVSAAYVNLLENNQRTLTVKAVSYTHLTLPTTPYV